MRITPAMVAQQAARESAYKPSTHCAGKAGVFPLNLYAHVQLFYIHHAHEIVGAARTRLSLRPLFKEARTIL
jgi:hypothetical protein